MIIVMRSSVLSSQDNASPGICLFLEHLTWHLINAFKWYQTVYCHSGQWYLSIYLISIGLTYISIHHFNVTL